MNYTIMGNDVNLAARLEGVNKSYASWILASESTWDAANTGANAGTLLGRRLYLPDINSKNPQRRQASERLAINAPMQGSAADIIKRAMIKLDEITRDDPDIHMIMQVHDELVFEVRSEKIAFFSDLIKQHMEAAAELVVPLIVDVGVGENWDEAH